MQSSSSLLRHRYKENRDNKSASTLIIKSCRVQITLYFRQTVIRQTISLRTVNPIDVHISFCFCGVSSLADTFWPYILTVFSAESSGTRHALKYLSLRRSKQRTGQGSQRARYSLLNSAVTKRCNLLFRTWRKNAPARGGHDLNDAVLHQKALSRQCCKRFVRFSKTHHFFSFRRVLSQGEKAIWFIYVEQYSFLGYSGATLLTMVEVSVLSLSVRAKPLLMPKTRGGWVTVSFKGALKRVFFTEVC